MTTSVIQAAATGLAIIATYHSAFPDQVKEGKNGFLVPEGDYEALAEKILYLMDHPELWPEFGRFGRDLMSCQYDSAAITERQIGIYKEVLAERRQ